MKRKDIEKQLKNEHGNLGVPDVFARAKKAPLNRLLDGQSPIRAFDKALASRLLWCTAVLLVSIILCVCTYFIMPNDSAGISNGYVYIDVFGEGKTTRYGIVVDENENASILVRENGDESVVLIDNINLLNDTITALYRYIQLDELPLCPIESITICVFFDSQSVANDIGYSIKQTLSECFANTESHVQITLENASDKDRLALSQMLFGDANKTYTASQIAEEYLNKYLGY